MGQSGARGDRILARFCFVLFCFVFVFVFALARFCDGFCDTLVVFFYLFMLPTLGSTHSQPSIPHVGGVALGSRRGRWSL